MQWIFLAGIGVLIVQVAFVLAYLSRIDEWLKHISGHVNTTAYQQARMSKLVASFYERLPGKQRRSRATNYFQEVAPYSS